MSRKEHHRPSDAPTVTVQRPNQTITATGRSAESDAVQHRTTIEPGEHIGRFVVESHLGSGGMGVVYRCHDPQLERPVAIKLLHGAALVNFPDRSERLMREAKAVAKLSHPNVVAIYEVGVDDLGPFIAMELVDGDDVRAWLTAEPRNWRDVLAVYLEAGRGLAAAHAAGLVHRDVKPDNIFVGGERVRIGDFGIAQPRDTPTPSSNSGTPRYMAPEHKQGTCDERSDQYSFCFALFEGIHGRPPDQPATSNEPALPRWLDDALRRGMSEDPERRFESMDALLAALDRMHSRRIRVAVAAVIVAAAMGGIAIYALNRNVAMAKSAPDQCATAGVEMDAVWNASARARVKQTFLAVPRSYAASSFRRVDEQLTRYAGVWASERTMQCHESSVAAAATAELRANRERCLDSQLERTRLLVDTLAHADRRIVDHGFTMVRKLEQTSCSDDRVLSKQLVRPHDAQRNAAVRELERKIDALTVQFFAGKQRENASALAAVVAEATKLNYPPTLSDALYLKLSTEMVGHKYANAVATARSVIAAASAAKDDTRVAFAWINLIQATERTGKRTAALELEHAAASAVLRAGNSPRLRTRLAQLLGNLYRELGKPAESRKHLGEALRLAKKYFPNSNAHAVALTNLAIAEQRGGSLDKAAAMLERAIAIMKERYDPHHPRLLEMYGNLASVLSSQGKLARANALFQTMLTILRAVFPPGHPYVPMILDYLAKNSIKAGDHAGARKYIDESLALRRKRFGPKSPRLADPLMIRGQLAFARADAKAALADCRRASALYEKRPNNPVRIEALSCMGRALVQTNAARDAIAPLTKATKLAVHLKLAPRRSWQAHTWLARALWAARRNRARAKKMLAQWLIHAPADERKKLESVLATWR